MNPPTTLTNHNPPATIGCGLNPNPIRREESDTPHFPADANPINPETRERSGLVRRARALGFVSVVAVYASLLAFVPHASAQAGAYLDVPSDAYYTQPVTELAARGVLAGTDCDESMFCPSEPIDRRTMAVWTVRMLDGQDPPAIPRTRFHDVDAASFHGPFIERMAELGVTQGCGDGSEFCPDRTVTRAQMAVFLSRAYNLADGTAPSFADVPDDAWYAADVGRLAASGITTGCGDGANFCPGRDTTRAEMATFLYRATDEDVETIPSVIEVSAVGESLSVGLSHACAVRADHTVTCWGENNLGQSDPPRGKFLTVSVGIDYSCGIRVDGGITCWGGWGLPTNMRPFFSNTDVPAGSYLSIDAGLAMCGVRTDHTAYCWGDHKHLGVDERFYDNRGFSSMSNGYRHSCGLRTDQTVACWNDPNETYSPDGRFVAVSVGASRDSCGVQTDQIVACWNNSGETYSPDGRFVAVSVGASGDSCGVQTDQIVACWNNSGETYSPDGRFVAVSVGRRDVSCGVQTDQTVACWNNSGDAGKPSWEIRDEMVEVRIPDVKVILPSYGDGMATFRYRPEWDESVAITGNETLSVGFDSACGIRTDRTIDCWGNNDFGQLEAPSGQFAAVSAGHRFACGIRTDRTIDCWGNNDFGQLEAPSDQFAAVSAGHRFACGIRTDRTLTCWGWVRGSYRTLTTYIPATHLGTIDLHGQFRAVQAFTSNRLQGHACVLRIDGIVLCFGLPHDVNSAKGSPYGRFVAISAGWTSCGLTVDQSVECTGHSREFASSIVALSRSGNCVIGIGGHLACQDWSGDPPTWHGDPANWRGDPPTGQFAAVSDGSKFGCALRTDATVVCWFRSADGVQFDVPSGRFTLPPGAESPVSAPPDEEMSDGLRACLIENNYSEMCFVRVSYPRSIMRLRSSLESCGIEIKGLLYDISPGSTDYSYPGEGDIYELCGQDATSRFEEDEVGLPPIRHLRGSLRG